MRDCLDRGRQFWHTAQIPLITTIGRAPRPMPLDAPVTIAVPMAQYILIFWVYLSVMGRFQKVAHFWTG